MKDLRCAATTAIAAATLALATTFGGGARVASAATAPQLSSGAHTFDTTLSPHDIGGGLYAGILKLRVASDGTLTGYFRYADVGTFRTVVGGIDGANVWLDFGTGPAGRLTGARVENGKIVGGLYLDGQPYDFVATAAAP